MSCKVVKNCHFIGNPPNQFKCWGDVIDSINHPSVESNLEEVVMISKKNYDSLILAKRSLLPEVTLSDKIRRFFGSI